MRFRAHRVAAVALVCFVCAPGRSAAQEIDPRSYTPNPTNLTILVAAYGYSTGAVLTDPALPVEDVEAELNAAAVGVGRTFGLFGRSANSTIVLPFVQGDFTGTVDDVAQAVSRSGIGDARLRLTTNLLGGPALSPAEFARHKPQTTLGASVTVSVPTGEYHSDKLINVGNNRWAIKPELGLSHPVGPWLFEAYAGVWLFGDNDNFRGGHRRKQDPLTSLQAHVSYTFRPRLWLALDSTFYDGGRTSVDGVDSAVRQSNSRVGLTLSVPVGKSQSLKFSWNQGATTRVGSDFTYYGIAWQYTMIDR
jgi:outer membrane putative beta-barrel porin/alpha-amylase